jgi:hypothetical protein
MRNSSTPSNFFLFPLVFALALALPTSGIRAQAKLSNGSPTLLIDFSSSMPTSVGSNPSTAFTGVGFSPDPVVAGRLNSNAWAVTGWSNGALAFGGTQVTANTDYTRGSAAAAVTTGGMYAYTGAPQSAANPALMFQPGGSDWAPGTLTLRIENTGTTNITELAVSYNIYVRNDQFRANSFNFSHSADDATYTSVAALNYTSPQDTAPPSFWVLVGTAPSRSTTITGLNIAPGAFYYIRWSGADVSGSGSRDEFGLDDINLQATFAACNLTSAGLDDVHCENNNETFDDDTDDYIWFQLDPTGTLLGTGYNVTVSSGSVLKNGNMAPTNVPYGAPMYFRLQAGSAGAGNVTVTITDANDPNCSIAALIVDPGSCSVEPCNIEGVELDSVACNDNSTPGSSSDDFISFYLDPYGIGLGMTYSVTVSSGTVTRFNGAPATGLFYDSAVKFRLQNGSAGGGNVFVTVTDDSDSECSFQVEIEDPGSCSVPLCDIAITDIQTDPETCPGDDDGSITVTATCSSCAGLEYSIDGMFWQASNVFTGLTGGSYLVRVRDTGDPDCATEQSADVAGGDDDDPYFDQSPLPGNLTLSCAQPVPPAATLTASDAVDPMVPVTFNETETPGTCPQAKTITRTWTATDDCGNVAQHTQVITIVDNNPPELIGLPNITLSIECDQPLPSVPTVTASDSCDANVPVMFSTSTVPGTCPQEYTLLRTWTATDDCGNMAQFTQTITVFDDTPPSFNQNPLPQNITVSCSNIPMPEMLDGTDNCDPGIPTPVIFINEFHYDNTGTDVGEFIEIAGTAGIDLSNYQIVLYNGANGAPYNTLVLSGVIDNEGGGFGAVSFAYPTDGIQNGSPDGIVLATTSGMVLQFLSYEGVFTAVGGVANGMTSVDVGVQELGTTPIGLSLQLTGTGQQAGDFTWVGPIAQSPGNLNAGQVINPLPGVIPAMFSQMIVPGDCNGESTIIRMWQLKDACNNSITHTQTITVEDTQGPSFSPPPCR